jgi:hypothetical protein
VKQGDALSRVLPYIVPVTGASFAAPGTGFALLADAPPIASYERIGALDVGGVSWRVPAQGHVADCYLIATMSALAWARPATWVQRLSEATHGSKDADALSVSFHAEVDGLADPPAFDVPPRVPLDVGHNWIYAHSAQSEETWPALLERAYVMQACGATEREPTIDDYRSIGAQRHWPHAAGRALIGGTAKSRRAGDAATLFSDLVSRCDASLTRFPTMAWTKSTVSPGLVQDHAYSVLGTLSRDERQYVVLRKPYGVNARTASFAGGEWDEGAPRNGGQPVTLDANGVFALPESDFDASFDGLGWVEVPEDPPAA